MPGRVKAAFSFLLLLLLLPRLAEAQCSFSPRASAPFRASMLDLAVDGSDLWAATGYGVQLFDRTVDPPALVATIALPDTTRVVRAAGGLVYAGSGTSLYVLRKNGRAIQIVRRVAVNSNVNDLAIATALFAATDAGIVHFSLVDPTNPTRTSASLPTSSGTVTSLSIAGSTLYAADGDSSVETFAISLPSQPQRTGALDSLPRSIAVHATATRVYVSDGQNTDVFVNGTRVARTAFGATSFAPISTDEHFLAGTELAVHAVDFSVGNNPAELYEQPIAPTPGTINRVTAMQLAGNRLYVAAGDAGLAAFDVSSFSRPYPVRSLGTGPTTSAILIGNTASFTPPGGGISEYGVSGNFLTFSRTTSTDRSWTLTRNQSVWAATSGNVALAGEAKTFPKTILSAAIQPNRVLAVLDDQTLWSHGLAVGDAVPSNIATTIKPTAVTAFGNAAALIELVDLETAAKTNVHYFADGDVAKAPRTFTVPGAPIGNVALSATHAALATYQGVTLIELATGNASVLPDSSAVLARQFVFAGSKLLELTDRSLLVWDVAARRLSREISLPADAIGFDASETLAVIATADGVATVSFDAPQRVPQLLPIRNANRYYAKIVAGKDRLYTLGENGIDIYATSIGDAPQFLSGLRTAGFVDVAASDDYLFTLSASGLVTTYSRDGEPIEYAVPADTLASRPLAIVSVAGSPWVSVATNCTAGICREKKTHVFDPVTLNTTATMTGGVTDVVTSGQRAYALFDAPAEVRVLSVADPRSPGQIAARGLTGFANSVAYSAGVVYVAGAQVQAFDEAALAPSTKTLTPLATDAVTALRFIGSCGVLAHRTFAPEFHPTSVSPFAVELPSAIRSMAIQPGRIFFLTDTSIEVWSSVPATQPSRRRPVH